MKVVTFQPALPHYRLDFFRKVHAALGDNFSVCFSHTELAGITLDASAEPWARQIGSLRSIIPGFQWQEGALSVPIGRGDVVVICGAPRTLSTLAVIAKAKLKGAKVIWWGHFWTSTSKTWRFRIRMQMLRACDGILFYSDKEVEEYLSRRSDLPASVVGGLNNGINTDLIEELRQPYAPAQRDYAILFIGRLTPKAQLPLALEALAIMPPCRRPMFEIVGIGEERERLARQARTLGVEDSITWHGAITDEARIAEIANRCRLFLYPGEVGLSLIHAMAYGLPAVIHSARWRQMPEFAAFEEGETGRVFEYGDAHSLAETLMTVDGEEEMLTRYSASALSRVKDTFNTRDMAERFVAMVRLIAKTEDFQAGMRPSPEDGSL